MPNMTCRQVVGRNAYKLGHVEPIMAKKLMFVGQNVVMLLALYLPSTTHALLESSRVGVCEPVRLLKSSRVITYEC